MEQIYLTATIVLVVDLALRLGLSVRIVMRRRPVRAGIAEIPCLALQVS